ncbi:MAG: hypothetical protein IJW67_04775, partial [Blautia sp.]|nr:hypothetical protein [Blautia sp.]
QAMRRVKCHKYRRHGDAVISLIIDNCAKDIDLQMLCCLLWSFFQNAFLGRVFLDVFYMMRETFLHDRISDYEMQKRIDLLQKNDWVRFVFLISDVRNDELLVEQDELLFSMIWDSITLVNSSFRFTNHHPRSLTDEFWTVSEGSGSKLFTLGKETTELGQRERMTLLKYVLMKKIRRMKKLSSEELIYPKLDFEMLSVELKSILSDFPNALSSVEANESLLAKAALQYTNGEILTRFYYDNTEKVVLQKRKEYQEEWEHAVERFCQAYLKEYLNESLLQLSNNIIASVYYHRVAEMAEKEIVEIKKIYFHELLRARNDNEQWKQKVCRHARFRERGFYGNNFQIIILKEWGMHLSNEWYFEMMCSCFSKIQIYINTWEKRLACKCNTIKEYEKKLWIERNIVMQDIGMAKSLLMEKYLNVAETIIEEKNEYNTNCYQELCGFILEDAEENWKVDKMIEEITERLFVDISYSLSRNPYLLKQDVPDRNFMEKLMQNLLDNPVFQMRGGIFNQEPFICFMGSGNNLFMNFLKSKNRNLLFYSEQYQAPVILYYQHIKKIGEVFSYALRSSKFENARSNWKSNTTQS